MTPDHNAFKIAKALLGWQLGIFPSNRTTISRINDDSGYSPAVCKSTVIDAYAGVALVLSNPVCQS